MGPCRARACRLTALLLLLTVASPALAEGDPPASAPAAEPAATALVTPATPFDLARQALVERRFTDAAALAEPLIEAAPDAATRRDATHLLARAQAGAGDHAAAAKSYAAALALGQDEAAPTAIPDVLRMALARELVALGDPTAAEADLRAIDDEPSSALREEAVRLRAHLVLESGDGKRARNLYEELEKRWPDAPAAREAWVRLAALDLAAGRADEAQKVLERVARTAPASRAGLEAALILRERGLRVPLDPEHPTLDDVEYLNSERRFTESLPRLEVLIADAVARKDRRAERRARDLLMTAQYQLEDFAGALATSAWLDEHGGGGLSDYTRARALAYTGDMAAAEKVYVGPGEKNRAAWSRVAELRYEFGQYREAYRAYYKARQRGKREPSETDRMVWCLLRMGEAEKAAKYFRESGGNARGKGRLWTRYWYGRALTLAGKADDAKVVFAGLAEDAPLDYYGVQAWSRLAELEGTAPDMAKNAVPGATVFWTPEAAAGAFDEAPRRPTWAEIDRALGELAAAWGDTVPAAARARELARVGLAEEAAEELRVIDMDLRAMAYGGRVSSRARADLLDNRANKRARGGERLSGSGRYTKAQARAFAAHRGEVRAALRAAQKTLHEVYGMRRAVFEAKGLTDDPEDEIWRDAYPIAFPELVSPFTKQFGVPPYYLYAIMHVESAYHPHAISVSDAYGLLQVIPKTGRRVAAELGYGEFSPELLLEPPVGVYFGTYYLGRALAKFGGQEPLAAAAYNAGPHRVAAWLHARGEGPMDMFIEEIPFDQARAYAKSVLKHLARYRAAYHGEQHTYVSNELRREYLPEPNY
ncbi:MAG: transglycosylase SLT domain-containing protein [Myxococcales bacterium]|nr:transglycosylase SLT domain-containing protein [Myxococcales bacterium]MCB9736657.1 transglycosylase SLT domain-containing protein [Deltaproteobacteria bacterium]